MFFDSFDNIEKYINRLKAYNLSSSSECYLYTIKAFEEYKAGNHEATHYIAYNEIRLLNNAEFIKSCNYFSDKVEASAINTWGFDYEYRFERVETVRSIFKTGDKYYVAIKAVLYNPYKKYIR